MIIKVVIVKKKQSTNQSFLVKQISYKRHVIIQNYTVSYTHEKTGLKYEKNKTKYLVFRLNSKKVQIL